MINDLNILKGLILKQLRGMELQEEEKAQLEEWIAASSRNRQLMEDLQNGEWLAIQLAGRRSIDIEKGRKAIRIRLAEEKEIRKRPVSLLRLVKYAAAVVLLIVAGLPYYLPRPAGKAVVNAPPVGKHIMNAQESALSPVIRLAVLTAPPDRNVERVLPDGSKVWLNAHSTLSYPTVFDGATREVTLDGEASFEVARDPKAVFRVKTKSGAEIIVLGTSFVVRAYKEEKKTWTTLQEGSVKIVDGGREVVLSETGQQAGTDSGSTRIRVWEHTNIAAAIAWKKDCFYFDSPDIYKAMSELKRWYGMEHVHIAKGVVTGTIGSGYIQRSLPLATVLENLERKGLHFSIYGRTIFVDP